jgi:hypothetical protein
VLQGAPVSVENGRRIEIRIIAEDDLYEAEGQRVRKTVAGVSVDYLYDLGRKPITELSATGSFTKAYGCVQNSFPYFGKEVELLRRSAAVMKTAGRISGATQYSCMPCCNQLLYQMRCRKTDKLPWGYNFCFLPESRKMSSIAGHQIVRTRSVRAFQEYIVRGISCHFKLPGRDNGMTVVLDELQQLQPKTLSDPELGTDKHLTVFPKDGMRDIQAGRLRSGNQENSTLQPGGLDCSRNQDICIDHQTDGKHYRFDF